MTEREADVSKDHRIQYRIGINIGDIVVEGNDIFGDGVNIAARIEGLCQPDNVYLSGTAYDHVNGKTELSFESLGENNVKNITKPILVYRVILDAPESKTSKSSERSNAQGLSDKPSIAVLPFDNMSGDTDQDFIGDGLTEDIIAGLSRIRSYFVIARNSTFQYKGTSPDIRRVSQELGVRYVLVGSVRKASDRIRVAAQLIDAANNNHLWAERFDRNFTDIFAVQDEITGTIIAQLEPEVGLAEYERVKSEPPENLDAWELYHRGLAHIFRRTKEDILQGRGLFKRAIELDPNFAGGHAGIAWTFSQDAFFETTKKAHTRAFDAVQTAVALDKKMRLHISP